MVPENAFSRAATPVIRRIEHDRYRVSPIYRGVMSAMAEWICDPEFNMGKAWEKARLPPRYTSDLARDLGSKPGEYLRDRRMEIVALLFLDPSLEGVTNKAIAAQAGFEYKTFGDNFPKWSGQTPSEFRKVPCPKIVEHLRRITSTQPPDTAVPTTATTQWDLGKLYAGVAGSVAGEKLAQARRAAVTGRFETAIDLLPPVLDSAAEHELDEIVVPAHAYLGFAHHQRAAVHVDAGRVDEAWSDLGEAGEHYLAAGGLPHPLPLYRRRIAVSHDRRAPLLETLCPRCRPRLLGEKGRELRRHLERALDLVPHDLPWFTDACPPCCQNVWDAIHKARLGLLDDAWQATWLALFADPLRGDAPPSIGRFIALLHASEMLTFGDQSRRAEVCRQAVDVAAALGDTDREALARLHYGNALRAMGRHKEAEEQLDKAKEPCRDVPWLRAFFCFVRSVLELQEGRDKPALADLEEAFELYVGLDEHIAGLVQIERGDVHRTKNRYAEALEAFRACEPLLDNQRAPLMLQAVLPINFAAALSGLGKWTEASDALMRCDYDQSQHHGILAMEKVNQACIELGRGRPQEALHIFAEAKALCEGLQRWHDTGLVALYAVEAYSAVNNRLRAIESCTEALRIFRISGCDHRTEEALRRLGKLLEPLAVDLAAVTILVRQLAVSLAGAYQSHEADLGNFELPVDPS